MAGPIDVRDVHDMMRSFSAQSAVAQALTPATSRFLGRRLSMNSDSDSLAKSFRTVDEWCRLHLPDKFLAAFDQMPQHNELFSRGDLLSDYVHNLQTLAKRMRDVGADAMEYSIGEYGDDQYCITQAEDGTWETYLGSRGEKSELRSWKSEADACLAFFGNFAWLEWDA